MEIIKLNFGSEEKINSDSTVRVTLEQTSPWLVFLRAFCAVLLFLSAVKQYLHCMTLAYFLFFFLDCTPKLNSFILT